MLHSKACACIINICIIQHISLGAVDLGEMVGFADSPQAWRGYKPEGMIEVDILGGRRGHL